jgi:hypothetical protein
LGHWQGEIPLTKSNADRFAKGYADRLLGGPAIRVLRGRPKLENKKQLVSIRYSPEVIDYFRASGAGWQARMDAGLKDYVEAHSTGHAKGP